MQRAFWTAGAIYMDMISLFSGAGGMDVGFRRAGFNVMLANDLWNVAAETYRMNDGGLTELLVGDIWDVADRIVGFSRKRMPDAVVGSPPCQDFSTAGKRVGKGMRADLTPAFVGLALEIMPKWIVMENVNTIMSIGKNHADTAIAGLRRAGYGVTATILNAADYGVPQVRKRFFLIGHLGGRNGEMLDGLESRKTHPVSVRDYYPQIADGDEGTSYYYRHPWSYSRRAIYGVDCQSPTIRSVNRPIPPGYVSHKDDATHDLNEVRPLTSRERAIVQTFPESYGFAGCKTDVDLQVGNAVPPLLAEAVAKSIMAVS